MDDACWGMSIVPLDVPLVFQETIAITDIVPEKTRGRHSRDELIEFLTHGKFLERAYHAAEELDCPVSVLIAQVILESNLGKSQLTQKTGNRGNIKCRCNRNKTLRAQHARANRTGSPVCVQGYDKIERSYDYYEVIASDWEDWQRRVSTLKRYRVVRNAHGKGLNWVRWTTVLHQSPYATDRQYGVKLRNLIRAYGLNYFDDHDTSVITSMTGRFVYYKP